MSAAPGGEIFPRVLLQARGRNPGPTLLVVAGLHGNEPAGAHAARRFAEELGPRRERLHGEIVILAGNLPALARGRRYIDRDLNRLWSPASLAEASPADSESIERAELRAHLDRAIAEARGPVAFVDLHTTSADGMPFALLSDKARDARFAADFPLTLIRGLNDQVEGVLAKYMAARRCVSLVVEAGQHASPASIDNGLAVLWIATASAGLLPAFAVPELDEALRLLDRARHDLPHVIDVFARYAILPEHDFRMEPGFPSIARVRAGQLLARDHRGPIHAPADGMLLMPLYQAQGDNGFFFGRESHL